MNCCEDGNFGPEGGSGAYALPEQWAQNDVAANQAAVALSAQVSTNFDNIQMIRAGSLVGLSVRFTEVITTGQAEVIVTINGVATALAVIVASGFDSGVATATAGDIPYVAGDTIGMTITTPGGFAPTTTDVEAWAQVQDAA